MKGAFEAAPQAWAALAWDDFKKMLPRLPEDASTRTAFDPLIRC